MARQAFIYTRVSTAKQASEGDSLEAQEARAVRWAHDHGFEIGGIFSDPGVSGKRMANRPGLDAALAGACHSGNVLIFYSLSRLARSAQDAHAIASRIERAGADLVSLSECFDTTTAAGRLMFAMLAGFAQFEREVTVERINSTLRHKAQKGERVGSIPYGYSLDVDGVRLIPNRKELDLLDHIKELRAEPMSWQQIADYLNHMEITTKTGRNWTWQTVRKTALLKRMERCA